MNNVYIITIIFLVSLHLGFIKYASLANQYKNTTWHSKFIEIWNDFMNFFITGLIGYFFISSRLPLLLKGGVLNTSDFIVFFIFMLGIFGHLCVISLNITEGIKAIISRVLEK